MIQLHTVLYSLILGIVDDLLANTELVLLWDKMAFDIVPIAGTAAAAAGTVGGSDAVDGGMGSSTITSDVVDAATDDGDGTMKLGSSTTTVADSTASTDSDGESSKIVGTLKEVPMSKESMDTIEAIDATQRKKHRRGRIISIVIAFAVGTIFGGSIGAPKLLL